MEYHCKIEGCSFTSGSPIGVRNHINKVHGGRINSNGVQPKTEYLEDLFAKKAELIKQLENISKKIEEKMQSLGLRHE